MRPLRLVSSVVGANLEGKRRLGTIQFSTQNKSHLTLIPPRRDYIKSSIEIFSSSRALPPIFSLTLTHTYNVTCPPTSKMVSRRRFKSPSSDSQSSPFPDLLPTHTPAPPPRPLLSRSLIHNGQCLQVPKRCSPNMLLFLFLPLWNTVLIVLL